MNIVWLSANRFGYELLKEASLVPNCSITVITLSAKSKTRMYDGIDTDKWYEFGLLVHEVENINHRADLVRSIHPDLLIIAGWRQMIEQNILSIASQGNIGFHPTLLPKGRGSAPIINSILSGFRESGVSMFYLDQEVDHGDIIGQEIFTIEPSDYAAEVYEKVIATGKKLIRQYLPLLVKGNAPRKPQNHENATFFENRTLADNEIDLRNDGHEKIQNKIRAFSKPYNGAFLRLGNNKLIIWRGEIK